MESCKLMWLLWPTKQQFHMHPHSRQYMFLPLWFCLSHFKCQIIFLGDIVWMCVPDQIACWNVLPSVGGGAWWRWLTHGDRLLMNGLTPSPWCCPCHSERVLARSDHLKCVAPTSLLSSSCLRHMMCLFPFAFHHHCTFPEASPADPSVMLPVQPAEL